MPRSRAVSYLGRPPSDLSELAGFPEHVLPCGAEVHRIHSAAFGPWYFSAGDAWRFNPCGVSGLGACYVAEHPVAGLLEHFKGVTVIAEEDILAKAHFSATLDRDIRLADCANPSARSYGVNGEIHTTTDYELTQAWASAFAAAGFDGVNYLCRSDPEQRLVSHAFFDAAGAAPRGRWPGGERLPISDSILREAEAYGLRVRPTP